MIPCSVVFPGDHSEPIELTEIFFCIYAIIENPQRVAEGSLAIFLVVCHGLKPNVVKIFETVSLILFALTIILSCCV